MADVAGTHRPQTTVIATDEKPYKHTQTLTGIYRFSQVRFVKQKHWDSAGLAVNVQVVIIGTALD